MNVSYMRTSAVLGVALLATTVTAQYSSPSPYPAEVSALMDENVNPCDDFYQYACGNWLNTTTLPGDKDRVTYSFTSIDERNQQALNEIMYSGLPLVKEAFHACMNTDLLTQLGAKPLETNLKKIDDIQSKEQLFQMAGQLAQTGTGFISTIGVGADAKNPTKYALYGTQSRLTLPDRGYYLDDKLFGQYEAGYRKYISTVFTLVGATKEEAAKYEQSVIDFEKKLAAILASKEELYDPIISYNPIPFVDAKAKYPLVLGTFAQGTGLFDTKFQETSPIILSSLRYMENAEQLIANTEISALKAYFAFVYINSQASYLGEPFLAARFDFFSRQLSGLQVRTPRIKSCVSTTTKLLPNLVGKYFAQKKLDAAGIDNVKLSIQLIEEAMETRIDQAQWLDEETKLAAKKKLYLVSNLIGFSEKTETFPFILKADTYLENVVNINKYSYVDELHRIGQDVDRTEWGMSGATVNAYYSPSENKIVFPAAILQFPFFKSSSTPAQNFGAIGAVVGHELTHGFDSNGRLYDGQGKLAPWWTNGTDAEYTIRAQCLKDQYSSFVVKSNTPGTAPVGNVNGNYTIGENIADNGGVNLAYDALMKYLTLNTTEEPQSEATQNAEKIFFVSYAQVWCEKQTDQRARSRIATDPHSPGEFRANGVVMNNRNFARIFNCPAGAKMNPDKKCELW